MMRCRPKTNANNVTRTLTVITGRYVIPVCIETRRFFPPFILSLSFTLSFVVMHGSGVPRAGNSHRFGLLPPPEQSYTHPSILAVLQDGGYRPEVVAFDGYRYGERVFFMDGDCLRVAQLI